MAFHVISVCDIWYKNEALKKKIKMVSPNILCLGLNIEHLDNYFSGLKISEYNAIHVALPIGYVPCMYHKFQ